MSSLDKSWKLVDIKREKEQLHRKNLMLELEVTSLKNAIENTCGLAEPYETPGGDMACGNCHWTLGEWEAVRDYRCCPFCGARIEWEADR